MIKVCKYETIWHHKKTTNGCDAVKLYKDPQDSEWSVKEMFSILRRQVWVNNNGTILA